MIKRPHPQPVNMKLSTLKIEHPRRRLLRRLFVIFGAVALLTVFLGLPAAYAQTLATNHEKAPADHIQAGKADLIFGGTDAAITAVELADPYPLGTVATCQTTASNQSDAGIKTACQVTHDQDRYIGKIRL